MQIRPGCDKCHVVKAESNAQCIPWDNTNILVDQYTPNSVPIPKGDAKSNPNSHSFMHAYHHPDRLRPEHEWVDWFVDFKAQDRGKTVGLEFQQGLWAEKLGLIAVLITVAIIVVSIVWSLKGGDLQTVFTVMGFVLTLAAGEMSQSPCKVLAGNIADILNSRGRTGWALLPSHAV